MSKYSVKYHLKLDWLPGWADCYVLVSSLTWEEIRQLTNLTVKSGADEEAWNDLVKLIGHHLLDGRAPGDGKDLVQIKPENVAELPVEVIQLITRKLTNPELPENLDGASVLS